MPTKIFFLFLFSYGQILLAQTFIRGQVLDAETNEPLHFATIAVAGQPYGTLSEEDGSFNLSCSEKLVSEAFITVSYLGYTTKTYRLDELAERTDILLQQAGVELAVINVKAKGDLAEVELGRKEPKAYVFYQNVFDQTYQLASRVSNPDRQPGVLTEIRYYFGKAAKNGKPVRLNFFAVDPSCDCPGEPLHAKSIIPDKNKAKWNKVDLTPDQVHLPAGDFFVAFEWLGLSTMAKPGLNFSVGMVYDKKAPAIYEKTGGANWQEAVQRSFYRPLIQLTGKR